LTDYSTPGQQQPGTGQSQEEILLDGLRRLKTHSQAYLLPRLIMTQQLWQQLTGARHRVNDSHRYHQRLLGEPVNEDDEGNISLQGDTTNIHNHKSGGLASTLLPVVLAAGLGAAALPVWDWWHRKPAQPPVATQPAPQTDWRLGLEVKDQP
jgi:hypothetical protein